MWDKKPTVFFGTTYSENGTTMSIPLSAFPVTNATETDAVQGDSRSMIHGLIDGLATRFAALPTADRPTQMNITRSLGAINDQQRFRVTYTITFTVQAGTIEVADE